MTDSTVPRLVDWALWYASKGWYVFPIWPMREGRCACGEPTCISPGKHPRIRWKAGATIDPAMIKRWWRQWPDAGIGLAAGPSHLFVVDADGPISEARVRELIRPGDLETLTVLTAKGRHRYYSGDGPTSSAKGDTIDTRGIGGYVVLPPSPHVSGHVYAFEDGGKPVLPIPAGLLEALGKKPASTLQIGNIVSLNEREKPAPGKRRLADRALDGMAGDEPFSWPEARRLASALAALPADCDGHTWYSRLAGLHALKWIVDGVDVGFEIAVKWSSLSKGVGPGNGEFKGREDVWKRWQGFEKEYKGKPATVASIYGAAFELGWVYQEVSAQPEIVNGANGVHALPAALRVDSNAIRFPDTDKYGKPKATCANARAALRMLGVACAYDEFHDRMHVAGHPVGQWVGDLTDNAVHMLRVVIQQQYRFDPGTVGVYDATVQECLQHAYDPVQDYLDGLAWDRRPRLDTWMRDYLGAGDDPLTREIARLSLLAAVRRAREPGTKFDQVVVLEGPEGQGKSSAIEILAGIENFSDQTILGLDDRAQQEQVQGVWLYEIADLAKMGRAENESTKALFSRRFDRARPAYGRTRVDRPRRCIFFGSTNSDTYLKSQTGNRRYWPVRTGRIMLDMLVRDRDQLWAETVYLEESGASLILPPALWGAATTLQDARRDHDPWDDTLEGTLGKLTEDSREYRISTSELMNGRLKLPVEKQNDVTAKRLAYTMRRLGWDGPKVYRDGKITTRGYTRIAVTG